MPGWKNGVEVKYRHKEGSALLREPDRQLNVLEKSHGVHHPPSTIEGAGHSRLSRGDRVQRFRGGYRDMQRFRGGLACKAHRPLYHSTLGGRVKYRHEEGSALLR